MRKFYLVLNVFLLLANFGLAFGNKSVKQPEVGGGIATPYAAPQPSHYTLIVAESVFDTTVSTAALVTPAQTGMASPAAVSELILTAAATAALVTPAQTDMASPAAVSGSILTAAATAAPVVLEQVDVSTAAVVSESAVEQSMFGTLIVQDDKGLKYQPEIYDNIGTDDSQESGASNNVRVHTYIIPANRQLSLIYEGLVGSQIQDFELNSSRTLQIKVSRNMVEVERVATRYEEREITVVVTENTASADLTATASESAEGTEEENLAVALAADDEDYEDDSGWNVDEEEELAEADEFAEEDEYEYVEVDEDEEDTEYAGAEDVEDESLAETEPEVAAESELAVAAENIVTRAVTVTESVPVTEAYLAQETSENIEFTLAFLEDLSERYGLTLAEQDYYTLIIAETLYDDTPERKAHAFGRLTVTDEDNKVFTTQARSWTDNSRSGAFDNNARLRRYLIPVNTTLQFKYRSGNTALSMIDCDELYPNPLLNYELDGTIGSLKVTKLEMNNNYAIHIRAGWGSADAGRPVRLVNVN